MDENHEILIKSADFRASLGIAPATMTDLLKKQNVSLVQSGGKSTRFIKSSDARKLLMNRGFKYPTQAKVIATMICKGGTGKSTSTYFLAHRMASYGARVLVIDADPQGNLTVAFNLEEDFGITLDDETPILLDVMSGMSSLEEVMIEIYPNLHLVPSTPLNSVLDNTIRDNHKNPSLPLKKAIAPHLMNYDYILIDCAPALNLTNTTIVSASDMVMLPVNPDAFSEMSLNQTLDEIQKIEEDFSLEVEKKIVFSKFDQREYASLRYLSSIVEDKKDMMFDTIIRTSADLKNAISKNEDLFSYGKSTAKEDYDNLTKELMKLNLKPQKKKRKSK